MVGKVEQVQGRKECSCKFMDHLMRGRSCALQSQNQAPVQIHKNNYQIEELF